MSIGDVVNNLISLSNELDAQGLVSKSNKIDALIIKISDRCSRAREPKRPVCIEGESCAWRSFSPSNYRYHQPTFGELKYVLNDDNGFGIKTVIRLNGNERQNCTIPTIDEERKLVEDAGKTFIYWDVKGGPAHQPRGYQPCGYSESLEKFLPILKGGGVLIHCRAGKDRTGYIVATYLIKHLGWSVEQAWKETIGVPGNDWKRQVCNPPRKDNGELNLGFAAYLAAFYPIGEWCKRPENKECKICVENLYQNSTFDECGGGGTGFYIHDDELVMEEEELA